MSSSDKKPRVSIKRSGKETQITDTSDKYWAEVKAKEHYEVKLPKALFAHEPQIDHDQQDPTSTAETDMILKHDRLRIEYLPLDTELSD